MALSRRTFLSTLGIGVGALAAPAGRRLLGHDQRAIAASGEGPRTIHLEARETTWELAPGKTIKAMAYNDRVPGPELRVQEGERVRVVLKNSLREPTTIHWHGVEVPNAMDGVPDVTQKAVQPGDTFIYEFEARPRHSLVPHALQGAPSDGPRARRPAHHRAARA